MTRQRKRRRGRRVGLPFRQAVRMIDLYTAANAIKAVADSAIDWR